jgi:hypothetical protein
MAQWAAGLQVNCELSAPRGVTLVQETPPSSACQSRIGELSEVSMFALSKAGYDADWHGLENGGAIPGNSSGPPIPTGAHR